jgi:hypothetical protein
MKMMVPQLHLKDHASIKRWVCRYIHGCVCISSFLESHDHFSFPLQTIPWRRNLISGSSDTGLKDTHFATKNDGSKDAEAQEDLSVWYNLTMYIFVVHLISQVASCHNSNGSFFSSISLYFTDSKWRKLGPTGAATATGDSVANTTQNMLNLCSDNLPKIAIPVNWITINMIVIYSDDVNMIDSPEQWQALFRQRSQEGSNLGNVYDSTIMYLIYLSTELPCTYMLFICWCFSHCISDKEEGAPYQAEVVQILFSADTTFELILCISRGAVDPRSHVKCL